MNAQEQKLGADSPGDVPVRRARLRRARRWKLAAVASFTVTALAVVIGLEVTREVVNTFADSEHLSARQIILDNLPYWFIPAALSAGAGFGFLKAARRLSP